MEEKPLNRLIIAALIKKIAYQTLTEMCKQISVYLVFRYLK